MAVEIYFGEGQIPLSTLGTYTKESLALAFSGEGERVQRVGGFVRVALDDGYEVLVNPNAVTYLREVNG
jgi:hypothetical protein